MRPDRSICNRDPTEEGVVGQVKHLKALGLCLVAAFALSTMLASPAVAGRQQANMASLIAKLRTSAKHKSDSTPMTKEEKEKRKKEKRERKEKRLRLKEERRCEKQRLCKELKEAEAAKEKAQKELEKREEVAEAQGWLNFRHCPVDNPKVSACFWAQSTSGSEFTAGKVRVAFGNPVTIQGGLGENEEETGLVTYAPEDGAPVLSPVPQHAPSLRALEPDENMLSAPEKERFDKAVSENANTMATIELAGPATALVLSVENLLLEEGTAIGLATKVKLSSLSSFLGNNCHVGSNEHPIQVNLTTGQSGSLHGKLGSSLFSGAEGGWLEIEENSLVNETFLSPGFEGCGEDSTVDEALDAAFSLPDETEGGNRTIITGTQKLSGSEEVGAQLKRLGIPTS
jgi:hypothetical protein